MADITLTPDQAFQQAVALQRGGRLDDADALCNRILSADPDHADTLNLAGVVAAQTGRPDKAAEMIRRAIALDGAVVSYHSNLGGVLMQQGRLGDAVACYERALAIEPDSPDVLSNLGNALRELGRPSEALGYYEKALTLTPRAPGILYNLGNALRDLGKLEEAADRYREALAARPAFPQALSNLGSVLQYLGRAAEAEGHLTQALVFNPRSAELLLNLGNALKDQSKLGEAMRRYEQALAFRPNYPEALYNLGLVFQDQSLFGEAIARYQCALALQPDYPQALMALGSAFQEQGRLDEAQACYERAAALDSHCGALQNLAFLQLYRPAAGLAGIAAMSRRWNDAVAAPVKAGRLAHAQPPASAAARPRIGFVSGDFCAHTAGLLTVPGIEGLSARGWDISCYSNSRLADDMTERFQRAATRWRPIAGVSDDALVEQIRGDGIDMLIDLSGHTGKNRLLLFARKPTPVQIAWAVGYPATTGLDAIDYLIADRHQIPHGADPFYVEKIVRLPDSYIAFDPAAGEEPVGDLPALASDRITFGSFNVLKKITPDVIAAWSRILVRLPAARLVMKTPALSCPVTTRLVQAAFAERGVAPDRLDLVGRTPRGEHRAWMSKADIALDPFPYTGGMTTLEALWAGLPVVTMPGETFCSRHSLGYLSVTGLRQFVAADIDAYVTLALDLASDLPCLARLRAELRQRVRSSPLCDVDRFAGHFDTALTAIWECWRSGAPPASFDVAS